jgi:hypothetical protein
MCLEELRENLKRLRIADVEAMIRSGYRPNTSTLAWGADSYEC